MQARVFDIFVQFYFILIYFKKDISESRQIADGVKDGVPETPPQKVTNKTRVAIVLKTAVTTYF